MLNFIAIDLQLYKIFKITQVSFLSRVSILTRDIDIASLSVRMSVTFRYQMKTAYHTVSFFHRTVAQSF